MFAIRYTGGESGTRTHTPFPVTHSLANCFLTIRITSPYGCGGWTRTNERTEILAGVKVPCLSNLATPQYIKPSQRTFTFGSNGWACACNHYQRSFHIMRPTFLIILLYIATSYFRVFKRFSFWSKPHGLEPWTRPITTRAMLTSYTRLLIPAATNSLLYGQLEPACTWQHTSLWLYTHYSVY